MLVLGIETSCDDTAVALYSGEQGLLAQRIYSQTAMHQQFGGIVPELASRDHVRKLTPLVQALLTEAGVTLTDLDGIAYTKGPGLIGALLVGATFAKSLAFALGIPSLGVHHLEGHLLAPFLEPKQPRFPFIALLVSGGHTMLLEAKTLGCYQLLGETLDDAAGEAFDKTARLLGLSYPGGPAIAALAKQGDATAYHFPRPMIHKPTLDMSFSGLKTHTLQTWQASSGDDKAKADIAKAFEMAVVDTLLAKCKMALAQYPHQQLVLAGGVSANENLRASLQAFANKEHIELYYPRPSLCTDNGAMIAYAGYLRLRAGEREGGSIQAKARWPLTDL